jgi:type IV pilus assembly protein PilB
VLRQDPNIIMVGEIRDEETAALAVRAAITGHLVLSTLHTNDAASSVLRLVDMGVEPYLVASSSKRSNFPATCKKDMYRTVKSVIQASERRAGSIGTVPGSDVRAFQGQGLQQLPSVRDTGAELRCMR